MTIKLSNLEAEHILYTLREAGEALEDPTADIAGVIDCIETCKDLLEGHFSNMEIEELDDISEFLQSTDGIIP
jgi:hypothetical protein